VRACLRSCRGAGGQVDRRRVGSEDGTRMLLEPADAFAVDRRRAGAEAGAAGGRPLALAEDGMAGQTAAAADRSR